METKCRSQRKMFVQHVIRFKHQDSYNLLANIQLAKKVVVSFL